MSPPKHARLSAILRLMLGTGHRSTVGSVVDPDSTVSDRDGDFRRRGSRPAGGCGSVADVAGGGGDFAERLVATALSLDMTSEDPLNQHGSGGSISLCEVRVGMIWEYRRHMGRVDLLR